MATQYRRKGKPEGVSKEQGTTQWYELEQIPGTKRLPLWARSIAISVDGTIFLPAVLAGSELAVVLCAFDDRVPVALGRQDRHCYVPSWWLAREYPDLAPTCTRVEQRIRAVASLASAQHVQES